MGRLASSGNEVAQMYQNMAVGAALWAQVNNGTVSSIIQSLGELTGKTKAFALFEIAANTAVGLVKAIQAGAGLPWPANLGAIASGTSAVLAGAAQAKQVFAGSFATGGVVGGNSFSGDNMVARVNSREMILNQAEQKNLLDLATGGGGGGGGSDIVGVLRGSNILLVNERAKKQRTRFRGY